MSNQVQRDFTNNAFYPQLERVVRIRHQLKAFVDDYDAIQALGVPYALPIDGTVIDTLTDTTPRENAPNVTGAQILALRNNCNAMYNQISAGEELVLNGLLVRDLNTVIRA